MKNLTILVGIAMIFISCGNNNNNNNRSKTKEVEVTLSAPDSPCLKMDESKLSFGKINKKKQQFVTVNFEFENSGSKPLVILKVDVSCRCFSIEYPKQPIKNGEKGVIKVLIDLIAQEGDFNKSIFVKTNSIKDVELLRVVGKVK